MGVQLALSALSLLRPRVRNNDGTHRVFSPPGRCACINHTDVCAREHRLTVRRAN